MFRKIFGRKFRGTMQTPFRGMAGHPDELVDEHIETEGLETVPLNKEDMEVLWKILMAIERGAIEDSKDWRFDADVPDVEGKPPIPFVCRVLRKRIDGLGLKLEFTQAAGLLVAFFTKNNPGGAMYILHKACNYFERRKSERWLLEAQVITDWYSFGFVTPEAMLAWWDGQKDEHGANRVDYCIPATWKR